MNAPIARRLAALALMCVSARASAHPDTAEARAELDKFIAEFPTDPDLYLHRVELRLAHSDWTGAEADLRVAEKLTPRSPRVACWRGQVCLARHDLVAAKKQFDTALAFAPDDAEALVFRARARAQLGDPAGAHADYSAAIHRLEAPSPDLFLARAALPLDPAQALAGLDEGLTRIGPALPLVERAIALELQLGRIDAAVARLDALAATAERKETIWKRRGDILAAAGRRAEARADYSRALDAIAALPAWLRDSPETAHLAATLVRLTATSS